MPVKLGRDAKIGLGWAGIVVIGIYSFVLSKRSIDRKRYENMKIRERMRNAHLNQVSE